MGRRLPNENISLIGPFPYLTFSLIGMVASIAIITSLCGIWFRRKSQSPPRTMSNVAKTMNAPTPPTSTTMEQAEATATSTLPEQPSDNNETLMKELPLPPAMQQTNIKDSTHMKRTKSERRSSINLSVKMPRSFSVSRNRDHKEENGIGKKEKLKGDESIWMKTIILGEKCHPDEEEDVVIYERKGKKISAYHPKNSTSTIPRQRSSTALDKLQPSSHDNV